MRINTMIKANCTARILGLTLLTVFMTMAWCLAPAFAQGNRSIKVMTQNMDAGTDLGFIFGVADPVLGTQLTYQEITASSRIPERAQRLAAEIAAAKPDIISLQEVTKWQAGPFLAPALLYDQLDLLMAALAARKEHYEVVDVQLLSQAYAPLNYDLTQFLFFTDRDVILARSGLSAANKQQGIYQALFSPTPLFTDVLGWMSVDLEVAGKSVRFFNTHLQSPIATSPDLFQFTAGIQVAQGTELMSVMEAAVAEGFEVILAGDLNSDASTVGIGPDLTPTAGNISSAGYTEVWGALHLSDQGLTWPRFLEDTFPIPASQVVSPPTERIDLIFVKGPAPINIQLTRRANLPMASDHLGVMATLRVQF